MFASLRLLSRRALASQVSRVQSIAQVPLRQFSSEAAAPKSGGGGGKWVSVLCLLIFKSSILGWTDEVEKSGLDVLLVPGSQVLLFGAAGLGLGYYAKETGYLDNVTGKAPSVAVGFES